MSVELIIAIMLFAFVCELIDASLGMGYGTILSPILLIFGFDPLALVPAILVTQAAGGLTASIFHHKNGNATFTKKSNDTKVVVIITAFGILATVAAAIVAFSVPKIWLKIYISTMVSVMGVLILCGIRLRFSWRKMMGIGVLSAFNKALTGGAFGPVVTGAQIMCGKEERGAIGCTTLAEAPICIASFLSYYVLTTMKDRPLDWYLILWMGIGAIVAAPAGAYITKVVPTKPLKVLVGIVIAGLGAWSFAKLFV